jgi:transposase
MSPIESVAMNLSHSRTRALNQLHALLRELMAGGAPISLTAVSATSALRGFRPRTGPDRIRVELAKELIADVRRFDEQLAANAAKMTALLDEHGTVSREIDVSDRSSLPVCWAAAARRAGSPRPAAYANYTGTASVQIASADSSRHPLSRYGDRQLNSAIYTIAMIQIRCPPTPAALHCSDLGVGRRFRFPKDLFAQRQIEPVSFEVSGDLPAGAGASDV